MSMTRKCDRCENGIHYKHVYTEISFENLGHVHGFEKNAPPEESHLCVNCSRLLMDWMNSSDG